MQVIQTWKEGRLRARQRNQDRPLEDEEEKQQTSREESLSAQGMVGVPRNLCKLPGNLEKPEIVGRTAVCVNTKTDK